MCKVLADLLGIDNPLFSVGVHQLEQASGQPSVDVKLYAEVVQKAHQKMRELGLDPRDTTAKELYQALFELVKKHDVFIAKKLGVREPDNAVEVLAKLHGFVQKLEVPTSSWALKQTSAKRLLKATPPKKVMKQLGYRSVDSMLKRENVAELFVALRFMESPEWLTQFTKKYKRLTPSDFETRPITFLNLDTKKWGSHATTYVRKTHHNVAHMKEMGVIATLPLPVKKLPGLTLAVLPLVLHYVNEIRVYSSYFKIQQVSPDFGESIVKTLLHDPANHAKIAGHDVHWRVIHRHFGSKHRAPEVFEPHVQAEDLAWRKAEEVLFRIEPALHFWHDMDFVGALFNGGHIISFNIMDMAVSYVNDLTFTQASVRHFRASLWNELFVRYIGQPALEYQTILQLAPESSPTLSTNSLEELFI